MFRLCSPVRQTLRPVREGKCSRESDGEPPCKRACTDARELEFAFDLVSPLPDYRGAASGSMVRSALLGVTLRATSEFIYLEGIHVNFMRHRVHPESFIEGGSAFTAYYESLDGVARDIADFAPSLPPFTKDTICTLETFDGVPLKPIEIDVVTFVSKMLGAHEKEEARAAAPAW